MPGVRLGVEERQAIEVALARDEPFTTMERRLHRPTSTGEPGGERQRRPAWIPGHGRTAGQRRTVPAPRDLEDQGDTWQLTCPPTDLMGLRSALEASGMAVDSAEVTMMPTTVVPLESEGDARRVLRLIDLLEEHDDVANVYANFDIPDVIIDAEAELAQ